MFRILIVSIIISVRGFCAIEVDVPEDWAQLEVPAERPASIRSMIRVLAPTEDAEATISEMEVVMSLEEAAESYVRGMTKRGFQLKGTFAAKHSGHDSRHITGALLLPDSDDAVPVEAYIILADESMLSVGVTGAGASSKINEVLNWIDLPAVAVPSETVTATTTVGRSVWEYFGIAVVFAAVIYAIFNAAASRKKKKDNKAEMATPRKPSD